MKMLTKTKLDRRQSTLPEVTIQEALENHIKKDSLPKEIQETLLQELKDLFLPYWADTTNNIVTVSATDSAELALNLIFWWGDEENRKWSRSH